MKIYNLGTNEWTVYLSGTNGVTLQAGAELELPQGSWISVSNISAGDTWMERCVVARDQCGVTVQVVEGYGENFSLGFGVGVGLVAVCMLVFALRRGFKVGEDV